MDLGGLPHLRRLSHLPGVPHLPVNRPLYRLATIEMTISGTFWCPRPLNRGDCLIKVPFKVNKRNKF